MTTPTQFSDVATGEGLTQPVKTDGSLYSVVGTKTVASGTAGDTVIGMIRLKKGRRVLQFAAYCADIDSGSAITLDIGVTYDASALSGSESVDGFADGLNIANNSTARNFVWPVASDAEAFQDCDFVAEGDGYLAVKVLDSGAGGTTSAGTLKITAIMQDGERV